jgi:hypothetical protein
MKIDQDFITTPTGLALLMAVGLAMAFVAARSGGKSDAELPPPKANAPAVPLPRTSERTGNRFVPPAPETPRVEPGFAVLSPQAIVAASREPAMLPEVAFTVVQTMLPERKASVPFGRMIPCAMVSALESNRLDTPVIGLVTEDVWDSGTVVIPAGAEVHGRAGLDRTRERIAVQGPWRIVWRSTAGDARSVEVSGIALERQMVAGHWGDADASAGLRGEVVKTDDDRELRLFAATFLASATAALQDNRLTSGLLGEMNVPAASARNAVLAGSAAVLREQAQAIREAIARDGFYLRVPAGKQFYVYVTQTIELGADETGAPTKL